MGEGQRKDGEAYEEWEKKERLDKENKQHRSLLGPGATGGPARGRGGGATADWEQTGFSQTVFPRTAHFLKPHAPYRRAMWE
ncbi:hypothetical protein EYF80_035134 [Liparis tanakae]|uniref:Uncharacterized protein n=1 Tax=Liparis tanakae TaxID=230148 RepID=A0A4Z2GPA3_9TELE|nr:hypothetical protein EYF80_035134 [Liparis tanakae]